MTPMLKSFHPNSLPPSPAPIPALLAVTVPDAGLGAWLLSATAALSIAALAKQFMRKPPLEAEFLTRADFQNFQDKLDRSVNALSLKLDAVNDRLHDLRALVDRLDERTKSLAPAERLRPADAPKPPRAPAALQLSRRTDHE